VVANQDKLELLRSLAQLCREEGVRRGRIDDVEVELAFVANPAARPGDASPAPPKQEETLQAHPTRNDWGAALGNGAVPVLRMRKHKEE
jgi:hypothetical protein